MRRFLLAATALLAGCSDEPDFDQRFSEAEREIEEKAQQIDADLRSGLEGSEGAGMADSAEGRAAPGDATPVDQGRE